MTRKANAQIFIALTLAFFFSSFSSQATTTFVLTNGTYSGGSVIDWLVSNTGTPDNGAPYNIIIPEDVEFEIEDTAFDLTTLSGNVTVIIEGEDEDGGQLKFKEDGAIIVINTGDAITVNPENEEGMESEDDDDKVKVDTDGASYTGHGLEAIVEAGGVQGDGTLGVPAGAAMPVEWADFQLEVNGQSVNVFWTTASEKNNDFFMVERSTDGIQFEVIGQVQGAGTIAGFQDYFFVDEQPAAGVNYYRIRQVDFDGNNSVTTMEVARIETAASQMALTVNAARQLTLNVSEDINSDMFVFLFDMNGKEVTSVVAQPGQREISIDLTGLQSGVYVCTTKVQGQTSAQKFFVR